MMGWNGAERLMTFCAPERKAGVQPREDMGVMSGLVAGTMVATVIGWRDVMGLQAGDLVLTFDNGLQPLRRVSHMMLWSGRGPCPSGFWPLSVPSGVLGNEAPVTLLPRQGVMLESDIAEERFGDPFALILAEALEGVHAIERMQPDTDTSVAGLHFESPQIVFGAHGALLFCPAEDDLLDRVRAPSTSEHRRYRMLPEFAANSLIQSEEPICA